MEKTALTQLEKWIVKFEETNGTPTMCEVKAQLEMFKEMEKEQIEKSFDEGWLQCNIYELPEKSRKHFKTANDYFDFNYTQSSE